ncbi:uncharacterized protein LOC116195045 [Punica granatum]|uniref:Transmembrane protein n=2 Tax=Punica granatum TaxID=22663 RepID=A0A218X1S8_PUNGR|nr:uncharacterized protein LOC116195045 [Punica granatum]OWM78600.1 hypothetical protein CDL15_Pgr002771 [Punica granatum]PKI72714.1 hypothetical protein CRG98_006893 [Punica granatum]
MKNGSRSKFLLCFRPVVVDDVILERSSAAATVSSATIQSDTLDNRSKVCTPVLLSEPQTSHCACCWSSDGNVACCKRERETESEMEDVSGMDDVSGFGVGVLCFDLLFCLTVTVFWGRLFAILLTCTLMYLVPLRRKGDGRHLLDVKTPPEMERKRRVAIMEGLLQRNRHRKH